MTGVVVVGRVRVIIRPIWDKDSTNAQLERMIIRYIGGEDGQRGDTFEHELIIKYNTEEELNRVCNYHIKGYEKKYQQHNPIFTVEYRERVVASNDE
jgi:hypothetical protein